MILLSASKVWHWAQRDGGFWSFLTWTKSHLSLHRHPGSESWFCGRDPSGSPTKSLSTFSSNWVIPYQSGCSQFLISSSKFDSSICGWKNEFSIWEILLPLHCVFLSRFPMRPSFPTPQCLQPSCHPSKFHPRTERIQGTIQVRLSFQIDGFSTGLSQL